MYVSAQLITSLSLENYNSLIEQTELKKDNISNDICSMNWWNEYTLGYFFFISKKKKIHLSISVNIGMNGLRCIFSGTFVFIIESSIFIVFRKVYILPMWRSQFYYGTFVCILIDWYGNSWFVVYLFSLALMWAGLWSEYVLVFFHILFLLP